MKKLDRTIKMKPRAVRGRVVRTVGRGTMDTAYYSAEQLRAMRREAKKRPQETTPEGGAVSNVEDQAEQSVEETTYGVCRLTRSQIRKLQARRKLHAHTSRELPIEDVVPISTADEGIDDPGKRPLSAREISDGRERRENRRKEEVSKAAPTEKKVDKYHRIHADTPDEASTAQPKIRQESAGIHHEKPKPSLPKPREEIRMNNSPSRLVMERHERQVVKTADAAARAAAKQNAAFASRTNARTIERAAQQAAKNAERTAKYMAELARKSAKRTAELLNKASRAAIRSSVAAAKALASACAAGGGVVVVIIIVLLMCVSILASPFGIFTHTDSMEYSDATSLDKAIQIINDEYAAKVHQLTSAYSDAHVVIEGNLEGGVEPVNWVDVLAVFSVHLTMRDENAMDVVQLDAEKLDELRKVFWDMNELTVVSDTDDSGNTAHYVVGTALSYTDMVDKYHFNQQQLHLLEEITQDGYYGFWSNYVSESMGNGTTDWSGISSVDPNYTPGMSGSVMKVPAIYQFDYKKVVCVVDGKGKSASTSGCGATSMCMAIHYLTGNTTPTPYTLFKWSYDNGYYHGNGLGHEAVSAMGKLYGVTGKWIGKDGAKIIAALKSGHPVIAHMGPGVFTKQGHYILLKGVTDDGKILVNDPGSKSRTGKAYPLSTILSQAKTSEPFMICSRMN